jgi:hypothetical protein
MLKHRQWQNRLKTAARSGEVGCSCRKTPLVSLFGDSLENGNLFRIKSIEKFNYLIGI